MLTYQEKVIMFMTTMRNTLYMDSNFFTLQDRDNIYKISEVNCREYWEDVKELLEYNWKEGLFSNYIMIFCFINKYKEYSEIKYDCYNCDYYKLRKINCYNSSIFIKHNGIKAAELFIKIDNMNEGEVI